MSTKKGRIVLIDGKRKRELTSAQRNIHLKCKKHHFKTHTAYQIALKNISREQRWLEVRLLLPINSKKNWLYWDGYQERKVIKDKEILAENAEPVGKRSVIKEINALFPETYRKGEGFVVGKMFKEFSGPNTLMVFPMSCVYSKDAGLALGIEPHQYLSYYSSGIEDNNFYYTTKVVIDSHQEEKITFILYQFLPDYGWRSSLDRYYRIYPDCFNPREGLDSRLTGIGVGGDFLRFCQTGNLWNKSSRRIGASWTWSYAPFHRTGNWYPEKRNWNKKIMAGWMGGTEETEKKYPGRYQRKPLLSNLSLKEFRHLVKKGYRIANKSTAVMSYIIPQLCEENLARREFPDSIWERYQGKEHRSGDPGVLANGEKALKMYAYGNKFGNYTKRMIQKILSAFKPAGIAFDNTEGVTTHFGGGIKKSPGRSFTEKRVYVTQGIAYAKLMESVRNYRKGKYAVASNTPGTYLTCRFSDVAIIESWHNPVWALNLRNMMGKKPIVWWGGPKEKKDVKDYILFCLRTGGFPNGSWLGSSIGGKALVEDPFVAKAIPIIHNLARAGWQPIPALKGDKRLFLERFGEGSQTLFSIINPTRDNIKSVVTVDNHYLDGNYLFREYSGKRIKQTISKKETKLYLNLSPKTAIVLKTIGKVKNLNKGKE